MLIWQDKGMAMQKFRNLMRFVKDEDGAVTVDWVVLTATILLLGLVVGTTIGGETDAVADRISAEMSTMSVWEF